MAEELQFMKGYKLQPSPLGVWEQSAIFMGKEFKKRGVQPESTQ